MEINRDKLNPIVNDIVDAVLRTKDDIPVNMIVVMVNYALAEMTASLRTTLKLYDGTEKPLNNYSYVFAESGVGKDVTMTALNKIFINAFKKRMEDGFNKYKESYWNGRKMELVDEGYEEKELDDQLKEEKRLVSPFSYRISSGTLAGVSKSRVTYGLYNICAVNLVVDELGSNYGMIRELIALMLSSYEDGTTEGRQLKTESVVGVQGVPSNFIGYSSPALSFDGGNTEKAIMADISQGMGRRSFFAMAKRPKAKKMSATERVKMIRANADDNKEKLKELNAMFGKLASPKNMFQSISICEEAEITNMEYHMKNENIAELSHDMQEVERIELVNRAWKALRLAGIYSFIEGKREIEVEHIQQAIHCAEVSGTAFKEIANQPQLFERMFKYMVNRKETTEVDLETKKWYSGALRNKRDLMQLCKAYGYKNDYLFRVKEVEGIDFYSFLPMPKTDPSDVIISLSKDLAKGYKKIKVEFDALHTLVTNPDFYYSAGTFKKGHRTKDNYERKQNLLILDVDDGLKLDTARAMLSDYKCLFATTKSHQIEKKGVVCDRYRIIFITDRLLKLDSDTYSEFMANFYEYIGIPVDSVCKDSSRMYAGADGEYFYSSGKKLIEIEKLIPDGEKSNKLKAHRESVGFTSNDGLESFFISEESSGRNHALNKYSLVLKDASYEYDSICEKVHDLNSKFIEPLSKKEVDSTVLKSIQRKMND